LGFSSLIYSSLRVVSWSGRGLSVSFFGGLGPFTVWCGRLLLSSSGGFCSFVHRASRGWALATRGQAVVHALCGLRARWEWVCGWGAGDPPFSGCVEDSWARVSPFCATFVVLLGGCFVPSRLSFPVVFPWDFFYSFARSATPPNPRGLLPCFNRCSSAY